LAQPFLIIGDGVPLHAWVARARTYAVPVWLLGVLVCSLRLVASGLHTSWVTTQCTAADTALQATVSRLATAMRIARPVTVKMALSTDGAATLGWMRPLILLPPATVLGLTPQQLEAVLAHELAHIRRHDYLVNLLQLVIETIFFYHPAVWWVSHRIRIERELCCDDAAVEACGDAETYARALATMAGAVPQPALAATGGSLRERIERLLGSRPEGRSAPIGPGMLAVALVSVLAVSGVWVSAQQAASGARTGAPSDQRFTPTLLQFEVTSVKEDASGDLSGKISGTSAGRFAATNVPVLMVIRWAYDLQPYQLTGVPDWAERTRYTIVGTYPPNVKPTLPQLRTMVQLLLRDRFRLLVHTEPREMPAYDLVVARTDRHLGPQLMPVDVDCDAYLSGRSPQITFDGPRGTRRLHCIMVGNRSSIHAAARPVGSMTSVLQSIVGRPVFDETGLKGLFDFDVSWRQSVDPPQADASAADAAPLFTALQEQLGLKLRSSRRSVDVMVVDAIARPDPN
jgi:uncharacterized protein (TIGR03435 family)